MIASMGRVVAAEALHVDHNLQSPASLMPLLRANKPRQSGLANRSKLSQASTIITRISKEISMHQPQVFTDIRHLHEPVDVMTFQTIGLGSSRAGIGHLRLLQPQGELYEHYRKFHS
jgi:hypothetical protein